MKIGDRVKFLSETGGGKIAGFQGKNIVLVEDEDGFQIPTPASEIVIVQSEDYSTANIINRSIEKVEQKAEITPLTPGAHSIKALMQQGQNEVVDMSVSDMVDVHKPITFSVKAEERKGGNQLSVYMAFVPTDVNSVSNTSFDTYIVNDSNYYVQFVYMCAEGNSWMLRCQGEVEPNTKVYLEQLTNHDINHLERITIQLIAYKRDKPFTLKEPACINIRLEPIKFYKTNSFRETPFFEVPVLLYTLIENDVVKRPWMVDPKVLKQEMYKSSPVTDRHDDLKEEHREQLINSYSVDQSKRNKKNVVDVHTQGLNDTIIIDLHAEQLLDSTAGMEAGDILEYQMKVFRDTLKQFEHKRGQKIIFIHGKGEGVLRRSILNELSYKYKSYTCQDASFREYGYGATQVIIK